MKALERAQRRRRVAERLLQGFLPEEIAEELGITLATVKRFLRNARVQWTRDVERPLREHLLEQLARLAMVEREAWREWFRSQEERERVAKTRKVNPKGEETQVSTNETVGLGEAPYLKLVFDCLDRRNRMLGLTSEVLDREPAFEDSPEFQESVRQLPAETLDLLTSAMKVAEDLKKGHGS